MHIRTPVLLLAIAISVDTPLSAQTAAKSVRSEVAAALAAGLPSEAAVTFDEPGDGRIWAAGATYKASVGAEAFTYVPFLGSDAPRNRPVTFALLGATVEGHALALSPGEPVRSGDRISTGRGSLTEVYDFTPHAVEQSFRFDSLPTRGELIVRLSVVTDLGATDLADGVAFTTDAGAVRYQHAVAVDAAGARQPLTIAHRDGVIELVVPAAYVVTARLPLVVDPLVTTQMVSQGNFALDDVDVAFDASLQQYFVVWQLRFSATDRDVWIRRFDANLQWTGVPKIVDTTGDDWQKARVAVAAAADRFLVAAQVGIAPVWIAGRVFDGGLVQVTPTFVIEKEGLAGHAPGDKRNPDVGGSVAAGASYFTVVWQNQVGADSDIHLKQVDLDGNLRTASPVVVAAATRSETNPSISSSSGTGAEPLWLVAFQRTSGPDLSPTENIFGAIVDAAGQLRTTAQGTVFRIDTGTGHFVRPSVSSLSEPLAGQRWFMVVCQEQTDPLDPDIRGSMVDTAGVVAQRANLSLLDGSKIVARPQIDATVDTDGTRFAVAFTERWAPADFDTRMSLFAWQPQGAGLTPHESRVALRSTVSDDQRARVFACASGAGNGPGYAVVHLTDFGWPRVYPELLRYDGVATGGTASRRTGCFGLTIAASGAPAIGHDVAFGFVAGPTGHGFVLGIPISVSLGCTAGCLLGNSALVVAFGPTLDLSIPADADLIGAVIGVQGFSLAGSACLGTLALSNTLDVTVQ